jgi:small conductance mechanosensitive channel
VPRYSTDWWIQFAVSISIALVLAIVVSLVTGRYVRRYRRRAKEAGDDAEGRRRRRLTTVIGLVGGIVVVIVWFIVVLTMLSSFGVDLGPLIASAGIAGVALGFGAQTLVRDTISGLFIVLESQYDVGDVVDLETDGGLVSGSVDRGGTRGGTAALVGGSALVTAALALIPFVGYLEAALLPVVAARAHRRRPARYAGLRSLARD